MKISLDTSDNSVLAYCECGWRHLTDTRDNAWRLALGHWEKTKHGGDALTQAVGRRTRAGIPMHAHL